MKFILKGKKMRNVYPIIAALVFTVACDRPKKQPLHSHSEKTGVAKELQEKWEKLAAYLKIGNNVVTKEDVERKIASLENEEDKDKVTPASVLVEQLSTPSGLLKDADGYKTAVFDLAKLFVGNNYKTQCRAIERIELVEGAEDTSKYKTYLVSYELQGNFAGDGDGVSRKGIITVPKVMKRVNTPFLAYAHIDDLGLSLTQLKDSLGSMLEKTVVVAPSFPGEPICKEGTALRNSDGSRNLSCSGKVLAEPVGEIRPWDTDSDELLGFLDCANRALQSVTMPLPPSAEDAVLMDTPAKAELAALLKPMLPMRISPRTIFVGASRGALVSKMALAKIGAQWSLFGKFLGERLDNNGETDTPTAAKNNFVGAYVKAKAKLGDRVAFIPPMVDAFASIGGPSTMTIGRFRVALEQIVKGHGKLTRAYSLAGLREAIDLDLFKAYREQPFSEELLKEAALESMKRDVTFLGPLVLGALKDWSRLGANGTPPGEMLIMHHVRDKIVPFEQSVIAAKMLYQQSENPVVKKFTLTDESIRITAVSLDSPISKEDPLYKKSQFHLDESFFASRSFFLGGNSGFAGKDSIQAFLKPAKWWVNTIGVAEVVPYFDKVQERQEQLMLVAQKIATEKGTEPALTAEDVTYLFNGKLKVSALTPEQSEVVGRVLVSGQSDFKLWQNEDGKRAPEILANWFEKLKCMK